MLIPRFIQSEVIKKIEPNKVVVLYGARQVGKSTLITEIMRAVSYDALYLSGEDSFVQSWLSSQSIENLKSHISGKELIIIDEAQKVPHIGINLKLIVDHIKNIRIIATGSSSFELSDQVGEPLVGRKWQFMLYPVAQMELNQMEALHETQARLETRMLYGSYPDVITHENVEEKREIIQSIVDHYLYKDLLAFDEVRKSQKIVDILKLLAFQIGREVSLNEIGSAIHLNSRTVGRYLDLLEKVFVIKRVGGFSRNLRKEVTKNARYYFYDNGVRNAIINNFNDIKTRDDVGMLWENYLFMERMKKQEYYKLYANNYFWRTYDQKEIDLVEEREGSLFGYEFKWSPKRTRVPREWIEMYHNAHYEVITPENYLKFIT